MTQKEIVDRLAKEAGLSKIQAKAALDSLISMVGKTLKKEGALRIAGLGSFSVQKRAARQGRNPRTGETIKIKSSKSVRFKASQTLKSAV